jgi:hypothetical protein
MTPPPLAEQLHADLLNIRARLHAGDFSELEALVAGYREKVQQGLQCRPPAISRAQCRQLRALHSSLLEEMRVRRDQAGDWLRKRSRMSAAIQAYNRSARRLFR